MDNLSSKTGEVDQLKVALETLEMELTKKNLSEEDLRAKYQAQIDSTYRRYEQEKKEYLQKLEEMNQEHTRMLNQ